MQTVRPRACASRAIRATSGVLPAPPACRFPTLITLEPSRALLSQPARAADRAAAEAHDQRNDANQTKRVFTMALGQLPARARLQSLHARQRGLAHSCRFLQAPVFSAR